MMMMMMYVFNCTALLWPGRSVQDLDLTMSDDDAQHLCSSPMFVDTIVSLADAGESLSSSLTGQLAALLSHHIFYPLMLYVLLRTPNDYPAD